MPSPAKMRATLDRYLDRVAGNDVDSVLALFSDEVSVEDPVGGPPGTHAVGRDAVERFFRSGFSRSHPKPTRTGPIRTSGEHEAAMPFVLRLELKGQRVEIDVIDVVRFDDDGRIISLRAFWNFDDARTIGPAE